MLQLLNNSFRLTTQKSSKARITDPLLWASVELRFSAQRDSSAEIVSIPDSKLHWPHVGPTWILSAPRWANVGPTCLALWDVIVSWSGDSSTYPDFYEYGHIGAGYRGEAARHDGVELRLCQFVHVGRHNHDGLCLLVGELKDIRRNQLIQARTCII